MSITRRQSLALFAATGLAVGAGGWALWPSPSKAGTAPIYAENGIAIDGTDTVAYFKEGKPVPGLPSISHIWKGAKWLFSTEENKAAFVSNPEAFAPQYGGYCAYAVSEGSTASTIPEAWKIVDGKLYLNYSAGIQRRWEKNASKRIVDADRLWPKVLD
ncbi:MAG: YHS domain-containing (seleno)protein [Pseudomonadota bacterium]